MDELIAIGDHLTHNNWTITPSRVAGNKCIYINDTTTKSNTCLKLTLINDTLIIVDLNRLPPIFNCDPNFNSAKHKIINEIDLNNPNAIAKLDKLLTTIKNFYHTTGTWKPRY